MGDWWILSSFTVSKTIDGKKGRQIAGSHNRIEYIEAEYCGDTGIQISGSSSESRDKWPRYNTVYGCISHDNADSAHNLKVSRSCIGLPSVNVISFSQYSMKPSIAVSS